MTEPRDPAEPEDAATSEATASRDDAQWAPREEESAGTADAVLGAEVGPAIGPAEPRPTLEPAEPHAAIGTAEPHHELAAAEDREQLEAPEHHPELTAPESLDELEPPQPRPEVEPATHLPESGSPSQDPVDDRPADAAPAIVPPIVIEETEVLSTPTTTESIFRPDPPASQATPSDAEPTRVDEVSVEEQKLAAERAARREARAMALAATAPLAAVAPAPVVVTKRTTDKFAGSFGLLLLRWVTAGILAIRGLNILTDIPAAQALFAQTIIPEPQIMAIVTGVAALLIALALVLGLLTRVAGLGVALIAGGALAFVQWGNWSPFVEGQPGFLGELELLLAAVGLAFVFVGAGGWSLDRSFRAGREKDKAERADG